MGRVQSQPQTHRMPAGQAPDSPASKYRDGWRRLAARVAVACVLFCSAGTALAQQPAQPPAEAPAAPTTTPVTRDMTLEYVIVLAMFGLALFAVCRSTRRN